MLTAPAPTRPASGAVPAAPVALLTHEQLVRCATSAARPEHRAQAEAELWHRAITDQATRRG